MDSNLEYKESNGKKAVTISTSMAIITIILILLAIWSIISLL